MSLSTQFVFVMFLLALFHFVSLVLRSVIGVLAAFYRLRFNHLLHVFFLYGLTLASVNQSQARPRITFPHQHTSKLFSSLQSADVISQSICVGVENILNK